MKIKFIPLAFILGLVASYSQITTMGDATFYISPNTEVYSGSDIAVSANSKIINNGAIRIKSGTAINNTTVADNFKLKYTNDSTYGQLIIESGQPAQGKISVEQKIVSANEVFAYLGVPFVNYELADLAANTGGSTPNAPCSPGVRCSAANWVKHPLFYRSNQNMRFDPAGQNSLTAGDYYTIRKTPFTGASFDGVINFQGTPYVAAKNEQPIPFYSRIDGPSKIDIAWRDVYGIPFYTYIQDPFVTMAEEYTAATTNETLNNAGYADRLLYLTNPFTSNLDLTEAVKNLDIVGIGYEGAAINATSKNRSSIVNTKILAIAGKLPLGDIDRTFIPPMKTFFIKSTKGTTQSLDLKNSNNQTFRMGSYVAPTFSGKAAFSADIEDKIYQVNLRLFNENQDVYYNHTYVGVGKDFITGESGNYEAPDTDTKSNMTGIYTLSELPTGGIDSRYIDFPLYINVMNSESEKVAIPVGINVNPEYGTKFTITARLSEETRFLDKEEINFKNPNAKFYFHDKKLNVVKLIDTKFQYTVDLEETTKDRFEIFWKDSGLLNNSKEEEILALDQSTTVYKSGDDYKVRFDNKWKSADIVIYSSLGQLISSQKNVNTQNDYVLPISDSSVTMYVVKIVSDNGEAITKKIIK